ncbi:MAG: DUF805 domain-containing protein [Robiginitomaculum sp.]|nr:DUF805 domain-containing protein [Robiginitomaculum sp.]
MSNQIEPADTPSLLKGTNWFTQYFEPFGRTSPAQFGRGWLMVVIAQILFCLLGLGLLAGENIGPGLGLVWGGLFVGTWMVGILHVRRLHDRGRSGWLTFFVYIPVLVASLILIAPAQQGQRGGPAEPTASASTAQTAEAEERSNDNKRQASDQNGDPQPSDNPMLQKSIGAIVVFVFFAFWFSLISLLVTHRMQSQPLSNRWGSPHGDTTSN